MQELKTTKYMKIFSAIGYVVGFFIIIFYSIFGGSYTLPLIGVIIIFLGRTIGYGIDRIIEYQKEKKGTH